MNVRPTTNLREFAAQFGLTIILTGAILAVSAVLSHYGLKLGSLPLWQFLSIQSLLFVLFLPIERIAPVGPNKSIRDWFLNLRINFLAFFSYALVGGLLTIATVAIGRHFDLGTFDIRVPAGRGVLGLISAFLISLFIGDFFYYWYHRSAHKWSFLWQVHKLHHMDTQLNVLSNGRDSWLEAFGMPFFIALPMAVLFKMDSAPMGVAGIIIGLVPVVWPQFYHSNTKFQMGKASVLLVCPQVHRIHHSRLPEHRDKNFANFFPIFDVLFGTYCPPVRDEFPPTGVEGEKEVQSLVEASTLPLREWRKLLLEGRRRQDTLPV